MVLPDFELIRGHRTLASAVLCAFDLIELDGKDLRREPIERRKALVAKLLRGSPMSIILNETSKKMARNLQRALPRSASAPLIARAARRIGSKSKI
jgi:ATP-dependent DNA ligase